MPSPFYTKDYFLEKLPHIHEQIFFAHRAGNKPLGASATHLSLNPRVASVVLKTLKRNPSWVAITHTVPADGKLARFTFCASKERLGSVSIEYRGMELCIGMAAPSLDSMRGGMAKTGKESSALAIIKKHFVEKSKSEIIAGLLTDACNVFGASYQEVNSLLTRLYNYNIAPALCDYVAEHLEELKPILTAKATSPTLIEAFPEAHKAAAMFKEMDTKAAIVVVLDDGTCLYVPSGTPSASTSASSRMAAYLGNNAQGVPEDQLPEPVKTRMAMLRLLDKFNQPIPDVGVRINESVYYVYEHELA